jgi:hypothetical protein
MERRWLHLLNQIERSRAAGVIFVIEKYSDEDQYDYPVWRIACAPAIPLCCWIRNWFWRASRCARACKHLLRS